LAAGINWYRYTARNANKSYVNNNKTKLKATFDPLRLGIDMGIDKGFHEASQTTPNGTQVCKLIE